MSRSRVFGVTFLGIECKRAIWVGSSGEGRVTVTCVWEEARKLAESALKGWGRLRSRQRQLFRSDVAAAAATSLSLTCGLWRREIFDYPDISV
jgi:hypothetical protein